MKMRSILFVTTATLAAIGYENKSGWKTNEDGSIQTDEAGNPLYIGDDGNETAVKYETAIQLRGEAKQHRTRAERAEAELKKFEGIDPKAAREALDKLKDVDLDKLVASDKLEEVKTQMRQQFEQDIRDRDEKLAAAQRDADNLRLSNAFSSSEFLNKRLAVPADAARATFRDRFKVEDGKVIPLNENGEPLYSKRNAGEIATVDEAFEQFIESRPDKDTWIKAPEVGGSGSQGGGGGRGGGNKMKRADFDALPPSEQSSIGQKAAKGEIEIVD